MAAAWALLLSRSAGKKMHAHEWLRRKMNNDGLFQAQTSQEFRISDFGFRISDFQFKRRQIDL